MHKRIGLVVMVSLILVLGIVVGAVLQGQARLTLSQALVASPTSQPGTNAPAINGLSQILRSVYGEVNPSVVSITVRIPDQNALVFPDNRFPGDSQPYTRAAGSGFVFDIQGHIVTNAHVVRGADQVEVTYSDGNMLRAKITGIDLDSDLAVIQVQGDASGYAPVPLGNSDEVQVGDLAIAIGNPFEEAGTMMQGIVSALHRNVQGLQPSGNGTYSIPGAIQTDAALNPGNSGGPLLNEFGQVIGVNEQIEAPAGQSSGISFAIPVNIVKQVVPGLIQNGKVAHPYLGIGAASLTLNLNEVLKLPSKARGALVTQVSPDSPAALAGIQAAQEDTDGTPTGGDVITAIDKQPINNSNDLIEYLFTRTKVGQSIRVTVLRDGKSQDIQVKLTARPRT